MPAKSPGRRNSLCPGFCIRTVTPAGHFGPPPKVFMHFLLQSGHKTGMMIIVGGSMPRRDGGMTMFYYWDPTYMLVIAGLIVCLLAQAKVSSLTLPPNSVRIGSIKIR